MKSIQESGKNNGISTKQVLFALFVVAFFSIGAYLATMTIKEQFSKRVHPLLASDQQLYAWFHAPSLEGADIPMLSESIAPFLDKDVEENTAFLQSVISSWPSSFGLFKDADGLHYFFHDEDCRQKELIQSYANNLDLAGYQTIQTENGCYPLLEENVWQGVIGESTTDLLSLRLHLRKQIQRGNGFAFIQQQKSNQEPLIGFAQSSRENLILRSGFLSSDLFEDLEERMIQKGTFSFTQLHAFDEEDIALSTFRSIPLYSFNQFPGTFSLITGSISKFVDNPYGDNLEWVWKGEKESGDALQEFIAHQLAERYPQAQERALPDETTIFELKQDSELFISSIQNDQGEEMTLLTYPDGQIKRQSQEGASIIEKVITELDGSEVLHSCVYPQSFGFGRGEANFFETNLWKTVEFSYDQQKMVFCFTKNT